MDSFDFEILLIVKTDTPYVCCSTVDWIFYVDPLYKVQDKKKNRKNTGIHFKKQRNFVNYRVQTWMLTTHMHTHLYECTHTHHTL